MKITLAAVAVTIGSLGVLAGGEGYDLYQRSQHGPEFRSMIVKELSYNKTTGRIIQQVYAVGPKEINADWGAKIIRGVEILCSGGGVKSPYSSESTGRSVEYTPQEWTGDDGTKCPPMLISGDILVGNWEHADGLGNIRSVSRTLTLE